MRWLIKRCLLFFCFLLLLLLLLLFFFVVVVFHFPRSAEEILGSVLYRQIWQCDENILDYREKRLQ